MMKPALVLVAVALTFGSAVRADRHASQDSAGSQDAPYFRSAPSQRTPDFAPERAGPGRPTLNFFGGFREHRGFGAPAIATQPAVTARRFSQPSWPGGRDFFRDHHRHHHFIFINSCWFWWDDAWAGWCYWPGPPPPPDADADGDWQFAPDNQTYTSPDDYARGRMWAQDLRREVVTWDQFVEYCKANVISTSPVVFSEFRRGFIAGYGENAEAAFNKAVQQAAPPAPG
jgi:hypothetical protein